MANEGFAARLLAWFDVNGRHDLPWQHPRTPYRVWLSEVMLQQTQVATVIPYFHRFVDALPVLRDLADAPLDQVLALWSGLGYYTRARNLHAAAKLCMEHHGGELPRDVDALAGLPGIGRSTAAAIAAQSWNDRHAILDGNVKRVLARYHGVEGWPGTSKVERVLWAFANAHVAERDLPDDRLADYTQAQMDFGATLCTPRRPPCVICPIQSDCVARIEGRQDELPTPRPAKTLPRRQAVALVLRDADDRVLLRRREPTGIWAALWSLPQFDDEAAADAWLSGRGVHGDAVMWLDDVAHTFSHYHLTLRPRLHRVDASTRVADDDAATWVTRDDLASLGIPAPVRSLLNRLLET
ncbi:A/G-specific adenine glycosylase [Lysobacter sp. TY2-98]|uniref:A/G-specific adenine glycosylase n=1 Tax=Lysobacter sp. TY2-98 TaxID=2290922 RepID=UPI000E208C2A|nr:A/G-specific adenine glycosylase [Lysobacter sp. TY2-98]AXK72061.1 A/G-specific adenine glycosylase [Lysobacter sp. TY2-98]